MRLARRALLLCLLSAFAVGQNSPDGSPSPQTPFHGIKILSSGFDSSAAPQRVQLEFINDSPANITAWGYCINSEKLNEDDAHQGGCQLIDPVSFVVDAEVQQKMAPRSLSGDCPDCHFIHPGEHKILLGNFSEPVRTADIQINLIAYSNGQVEIAGPEGSDNLQRLSFDRKGMLAFAEELREKGKRILGDSTNQHPTVSMINELESWSKHDPSVADTLRVFKKPEWRHANDREFIPSDERAYLTKFVTEQQLKAAEFAKYQVKEENR